MARGWRMVVVGITAAATWHGGAMATATATAGDDPVPGDDRSQREDAPVGPGLSVVVERATEQVRAGRDTTYTVTVENRGDRPEPVTVRVSVPPWMSDVTPNRGELAGGYVDWPVTVAPDAPARLRLTGVYGAPGTDAWPRATARVVLTACAWDEDRRRPIICASDVGQVQRAAAWTVWWLAAGAVVAAGAVAVAVVLLRRRRLRSRGT